jgi:hypothetical protein
MHNHKIKPSSDFADKVMVQVAELEKQSKFWDNLVWVILIFSPLLIREVWLLIRHDYFSVGSLPFKDLILSIYNFFVSGLAFNIFLFAGIFFATVYIIFSRRLFRMKLVTQIFSQARFRS